MDASKGMHISNQGYKSSETLLGIETWIHNAGETQQIRYKSSETLLGIETIWSSYMVSKQDLATKALKPF